MTIQYRRIRADEAGAVLAFMQEHYPPAYAHIWKDGGAWYLDNQYAPTVLAPVLQDSNVHACWCITDDRLLGWTQWEQKSTDATAAPGAYLHRLYLATDAQGLGVGRQVLIDFEAYAKTSGLDYAWLEAMDLGGAIRFYEREGYHVVRSYRLPFERMYVAKRGISVLRKELG